MRRASAVRQNRPRGGLHLDKIWLKQYPAGVPAEIDVAQYKSLVELLQESFAKYRDLPAYKYMGKSIGFGQVDDLSRAFAAYLQGLGLEKGDRVAIMLGSASFIVMDKLFTSLISSGVARNGPSGANVSQPFPLAHWPPRSN